MLCQRHCAHSSDFLTRAQVGIQSCHRESAHTAPLLPEEPARNSARGFVFLGNFYRSELRPRGLEWPASVPIHHSVCLLILVSCFLGFFEISLVVLPRLSSNSWAQVILSLGSSCGDHKLPPWYPAPWLFNGSALGGQHFSGELNTT